MRTLKVSFLFFILSITISAQWFWQNPLPQGNTLNDISFCNENTGICVGNTGTIMKTINGGIDWRIIETGFTENFYKIKMINELVVYVLGMTSIIKSTDGGETWFEIMSPPLYYFNDFCFIDQNKWYVVGHSNNIYYTSDAGNSWIPRNIGLTVNLGSIDFLNENYGISAGTTYDENVIVKTTNGGLSWELSIFSNSRVLLPNDMIVLSELKTFIVDNSYLFQTTNGGLTWNWVYFSGSSEVLSIDFLDSLTGFISSVSKIIKTSDGGNSWIEQNINIGSNIWLYGISVQSQNLIFAVGLFGRMVYSHDGGNSWKQRSSGTLNTFRDVSFYNEEYGIAIGDGIFTTSDAGNNWVLTSGIGPLYRCTRPSLNYCFAAGSYNLLKSTDKGFSWTRHPVSDEGYFMTISFVDTLNGVATTMLGSNPKIFRTFDGGENWQHITTLAGNYLYDICFIDSLTIYACGTGILKSIDGGYNWVKINSTNSLKGIHFINKQIGFAVGGRNIIKTTDAGQNWIVINSGIPPTGISLEQVNFLDEYNGIVIGKKLLHTNNGGTTWQTYKLVEDFLLSGTMINDSVWYAVGQYGSILKHKSDGFIPVELISFTTVVLGNIVQLNWSTVTETNNSGFEIQRKQDNEDFKIIAFVNGNGTTANKTDYKYVDNNLTQGNYLYRLKQIDFNGQFEYSEVINVSVGSLDRYELIQNYPNPFNPSTKIKFSIPSVTLRQAQSDNWVTLKVYDVLGNEVATLVNEYKPAGTYEVNFNGHSDEGQNLSSGVYFYQLKAGDFVQTKKMIYLK